MPAPTSQQDQLGYSNLWDKAKVKADKQAAADRKADIILAHKGTYQGIQIRTGVPWPVVGVWHMRESDNNFHTHLHCGDNLNARTYHVPKGRPKAPPKSGHFPYTFEESAEDALMGAPHKLHLVKSWPIERILHETEAYNGWGYLFHHMMSPYVWNWTDLYRSGKYVADGNLSTTAVDQQPGCAAVLRCLAEKDEDAAQLLSKRYSGKNTLPPDVIPRATRKERNGAGTGAGAAGAGTVGKAGTEQPADATGALVHSVVVWSLIGLGIAIILVSGFLIARKSAAIKARWGIA